jgi:rare lipoprotein A
MLAAAVAVSTAGFAATRGGPSSGPPAALAASVGVDREMPERASRSGDRTEEPVPPPAVSVTADGASRDVFVRAATVADLLARLAIAVDGDDEVTPAVDAPPGRAVTVVRVDVSRVTEERAIPVGKELRDDPALERGATRVEADGAPGRERVVWEIIRRDGKVTARRQVSTETLTAASPRVVIVGRGDGRGAPTDGGGPLKPRVAASGPAGGSQEGDASWYRYKAGTCAHRTLPKGTVVKVTNSRSGKTAQCTVADRGPFIAGRIVDLDHSVFMAIADSPGQGVLRVRIEW